MAVECHLFVDEEERVEARCAMGIDLVVDDVDEMIVRIDQKNDLNIRRWRE